jgi:hypothetical protein
MKNMWGIDAKEGWKCKSKPLSATGKSISELYPDV